MSESMNRARELHRQCLVVDSHIDTVLGWANNEQSLGAAPRGHVDLPRLEEAGVNVQFFAHFVEPEHKPDRALIRFFQLLDVFYSQVDAEPGVQVVRTVDDLDEALEAGRLAAVIAIEGGEPVGTQLATLRTLHRLGVRAITLTWNERNMIADGAGEHQSAGGLTRFGRKVVQEMNRLGMIVDVSHLAGPGFWDVLDASSQPVIASHSNARAICDHPRNLTDRQIKALAAAGGVMGLVFAPAFISADGEASVDKLVDHAEHILDLVGDEHLAIGSDFDGIGSTPQGLDDVSKLPALTAAMLDRGIPEESVRKILGANHLRILRQVLPGGGT